MIYYNSAELSFQLSLKLINFYENHNSSEKSPHILKRNRHFLCSKLPSFHPSQRLWKQIKTSFFANMGFPCQIINPKTWDFHCVIIGVAQFYTHTQGGDIWRELSWNVAKVQKHGFVSANIRCEYDNVKSNCICSHWRKYYKHMFFSAYYLLYSYPTCIEAAGTLCVNCACLNNRYCSLGVMCGTKRARRLHRVFPHI